MSKAIALPVKLSIVQTNGGFWRLYSPWLEASEKVCTRTDSDCPIFDAVNVASLADVFKPYALYAIHRFRHGGRYAIPCHMTFVWYDEASRRCALLNSVNDESHVEYVIGKNPYYKQYRGNISK